MALSLSLLAATGHGNEHIVKLVTDRSPFTQVSSIDASGGEATEFVQQVLAGADIPFQLSYLPWRRAYNQVATESNVMIFSLARTTQREHRFHWVGQLIPVNYYLFKLTGRQDIAVSSLDDARRYQIGVVNYHVHHEFLLAQGFTRLQPVNHIVQNLNKALLQRIDLFIVSDGGLVPYCERENIDCSMFEPILKLEQISGGLYMAYSLTTDAAVVDATRLSYQRLVDDGSHRRIFQNRLDNIDQFNARWLTGTGQQ